MAKLPDCDSRCPLVCPVCLGSSKHDGDIPAWGEWRICDDCSLVFANPLGLPSSAVELYQLAYSGQVVESGMREYADRLGLRRVIIDELDNPDLWFWTPAFGAVLEWVDKHTGVGDTVFEIGCGLGFVLHALRKRGRTAVGLDVAEVAVNLNRRDGFDVWHGELRTLPSDWVRPRVVVSLFLLHHLADPVGLLSEMRTRWPMAPVALAAHGPSSRRDVDSDPPRSLLRWNAQSLRRAFETAGYSVEVCEYASTGAETKGVKVIRQALGHLKRFSLLYRFGKKLEAALLPRAPTAIKGKETVLVAYAYSSDTHLSGGDSNA